MMVEIKKHDGGTNHETNPIPDPFVGSGLLTHA